MNEAKAESVARGERSEALLYVVDDEPLLLELASAILGPLGHTIKTFCSPESALEAFAVAEPKPALIITDYAMHTMTGLELAEACRRIQPRQKILMISGTVGLEIFQSTPFKPDRFLTKPYQANQLAEMVNSMLADEPG